MSAWSLGPFLLAALVHLASYSSAQTVAPVTGPSSRGHVIVEDLGGQLQIAKAAKALIDTLRSRSAATPIGNRRKEAGTAEWRGGAGATHSAASSPPLSFIQRPSQPVLDGGEITSGLGTPGSLIVDKQKIDVGDSVTVSGWKRPNVSNPATSADPCGSLQHHNLHKKHDVTDSNLFPPVGDVIAVYCPHDARDADYLDYREVNANIGTVQFGPLVNMRCEYAFRYLHQCTNGSYVATLASVAVSFRLGSNQPTQGRVSETGIPGEMSIMWVAQAVKPSLVEYRRVTSEESEHIITASGTSHTYTASDMCNHPANITGSLLFRHPGYIHRVVLRNLAANTKYEYRFGAGTTGIVSAAAEEEKITWSPLYQFTTAPDVGSTQAISFFVFGDLGEQRGPTGTPSANRSYATISRIEDDLFKSPQQFHFVLHVGDISYAEGRGYKWEQFGDLIQSVATRIPYYVGIGNHDYDHVAGGRRDPSGAPDQGYHPSWGVYGDDSGGECAAPIVSRFSMPSTAAQSLQPFWYSHDHGLIHVVWLSTEHDFYPGSDMHKFLVADLDAVNRTRTPWVFVMGHRPMYCSRSVDEITAKDNYIVQLHQRAAYEDVLYRYGVDVFFGGHYHAYERTCPVYNGTCRQSLISGMAEATVHLLVGTGGASQDFDRWDAHPWSRHRGIDYGYARVHVANGTHLRVQYVLNEDGSVADDAWIVSRHGWHL